MAAQNKTTTPGTNAGRVERELYTDPPFNLSGESFNPALTDEGAARAQAEAEYNANRQQRRLFDESDFDCTGTWDGCQVGTDADPGL